MGIGIFFISVIFTVIGMILSNTLRSKFSKYSQMPISNGMSGAEIADSMLKFNGIYDVKITQVDGQLTDHYNPATKTVNLSSEVYNGRNVASTAVAAHECGHAVQHAQAYLPLQMRSALVPVVNIAASLERYLFFFGLGLLYLTKQPIIMVAVLAVFGITALFSLITLPVEFDASRRALVWLDNSGVTKGAQYDGAKDALTWAALTYVSAALAALVQFLYLLMMFMGRRN